MLQSNMLQNDRTRALQDSVMTREQPEENGLGELVNFALGFLRRQYPVIIFTAVLALSVSAIYLRITPPTYTAQVRVLFGNPKAQFVQQQSLLAAEAPIDTTQLESQMQILKSKALATSVINQLKLADDPDFKPSGRSLRSVLPASVCSASITPSSRVSTRHPINTGSSISTRTSRGSPSSATVPGIDPKSNGKTVP